MQSRYYAIDYPSEDAKQNCRRAIVEHMVYMLGGLKADETPWDYPTLGDIAGTFENPDDGYGITYWTVITRKIIASNGYLDFPDMDADDIKKRNPVLMAHAEEFDADEFARQVGVGVPGFIPRLFPLIFPTGGVVRQDHSAVIGERGHEVIMPLAEGPLPEVGYVDIRIGESPLTEFAPLPEIGVTMERAAEGFNRLRNALRNVGGIVPDAQLAAASDVTDNITSEIISRSSVSGGITLEPRGMVDSFLGIPIVTDNSMEPGTARVIDGRGITHMLITGLDEGEVNVIRQETQTARPAAADEPEPNNN